MHPHRAQPLPTAMLTLMTLCATGIATGIATGTAAMVAVGFSGGASTTDASCPGVAASTADAGPATGESDSAMHPLFSAALEADLNIQTAESVDATQVRSAATLYEFYLEHHAEFDQRGPHGWAIDRAALLNQLSSDIAQMKKLEAAARRLEEKQRAKQIDGRP